MLQTHSDPQSLLHRQSPARRKRPQATLPQSPRARRLHPPRACRQVRPAAFHHHRHRGRTTDATDQHVRENRPSPARIVRLARLRRWNPARLVRRNRAQARSAVTGHKEPPSQHSRSLRGCLSDMSCEPTAAPVLDGSPRASNRRHTRYRIRVAMRK